MSVQRDSGSATVAYLGALAVLTVTAVTVLCAAELVLAHARAHAAADLAALAAASPQTGIACEQATRVALTNSATVVRCDRLESDVLVSVTVRPGLLVTRLAQAAGYPAPTVIGTARAGPPRVP